MRARTDKNTAAPTTVALPELNTAPPAAPVVVDVPTLGAESLPPPPSADGAYAGVDLPPPPPGDNAPVEAFGSKVVRVLDENKGSILGFAAGAWLASRGRKRRR